MQEVSQALLEVKDMFQKIVGQPAPEIEPRDYWAFPPGVDPVLHTILEVEHLKRMSEQATASPTPAVWVPRADSFIADDAFVVLVEVPGVVREDLKVFVVGGECVVRGERKQPEGAARMRPMALERPWGPFERRFPLPAGGRPEQLTARYQEGVLELRMALEKVSAPKEQKVDVTWTTATREEKKGEKK